MNIRVNYIIIVTLMCAFVTGYPDKTESDVSIIKNKAIPLIGSLRLNLKEETIFDSAKVSKEFNIYSIRDLKLDSEENIHVLASDFILKLAPSGKLLNSFKLKKGQGPGEIQQFARRFYLDELDNIYIEDGFRLIEFDKNMLFKRNIQLKVSNSLCVDKNGFFYTMKRVFSKKGINKVLSKFDKDGKLLKEITSYYDGKIQTGGGIMVARRHEYSPNAYFCIAPDNNLIYTNSNEYKLYIYDLDGNLLSMIIVDERSINISSREKAEIIEKEKSTESGTLTSNFSLDFPRHRPFFKRILCDEKGRVYMVRKKSVLDKERTEIIDIFNKEGLYLYQIKLPYLPEIIRKGSIYVKDYGSKDEYGAPIPKIKRLTILNYNSIKY